MLGGCYENKTVFYFGENSEQNLIKELQGKYKKVLLHYGSNSAIKNGLRDKTVDILNQAQVQIVELGGVKPNPEAQLVYEGIKLCKEKGVDFILALGGGSVIDSAKAIAIGVKYEGDFFDVFLNNSKIESILPFGTILTNCGSGSETSVTSVISKEGKKIAYYNSFLRSQFCIMNPQNTLSVPVHTTLCGIFDSITHVFERYFSNTEFVDCSDRLCEGMLKTLVKYAKLIKNDPKNYNYRAEIMWGCKMATDPVISFGRKEDWSSHIIAHQIGALTGCAHGQILAIIYPAWLKYCQESNEKLMKQFCRRIFGTDNVKEGLRQLDDFIEEIGLKSRLSEIGLDESHFETIAKNCAQINPSGTIGNFKRIGYEDIVKILESVK